MQRSFLYDLKDDLLAFLFLWGPPLETQREYARAVFKLVLRILFLEALMHGFNKALAEAIAPPNFLEVLLWHFLLLMYIIPLCVTITRRIRGKGESYRYIAIAIAFAGIDSLKYGLDWVMEPQRYAIEAFILLLLASDTKLKVPPRDWKIASIVLI